MNTAKEQATRELEKADQMQAACREIIGLMEQISDILTKNGFDGGARIYTSGDGFMSMEPNGTGWAMHKYSTDGRAEISLKCTLPLIDSEKVTEEAA